jgi:ribonucleoside-triphosphate reductase
MQVIKRDKSKQEFNIEKIKTAITKACRAVNENPDTVLTYSFIVQLQNTINKFVVNDEIDIEDIQNTVEDILFAKGYIKLGKAYVKYREEHHKIRNGYSNLIQKIYDRLHAINIENANANVDENSFSGREKEALSDLQKYLAFEAGGVSKLMADCHNQMLIYQHDSEKTLLGQHNCLFLDFKQIFENGFVTRNGDVRPPSNFSTACQLVAVAFQCESQVQFGGVGSVHIDYDLAPFVKKSYSKHFKDGLKYVSKAPQNIIDKVPKDLSLNSNITDNYSDAKQYALDMLNKEGKQACQGLYHNLNTLESRAGSQVPFTSINFGRDTSLEGQLVSK